jgi:hypothetical protein
LISTLKVRKKGPVFICKIWFFFLDMTTYLGTKHLLHGIALVEIALSQGKTLIPWTRQLFSTLFRVNQIVEVIHEKIAHLYNTRVCSAQSELVYYLWVTSFERSTEAKTENKY